MKWNGSPLWNKILKWDLCCSEMFELGALVSRGGIIGFSKEADGYGKNADDWVDGEDGTEAG